jgi:hypothetical protein
MYEIKATEEKFDSFFSAIAAAKKISAEVFEVATGLRRWAPTPKVSATRMSQYVYLFHHPGVCKIIDLR